MLIVLGSAMIAVFMYPILSKRLAPILALVLVPLTFALVTVGTGVAEAGDEGVVDSIMTAISDFAPTAVLLFFAIIFFGTMIDVGLFDPLIRFVLRTVNNDPVRLVVLTAVLAGVVSLDGDGSTTFIITVSALLPIYLRLGLSPVVLTVVANLANGVLNILPWGGPTVRAATVLGVSPSELFNPMVPGMVLGILTVLVLAWFLGRSERKRLLASGRTLDVVAETMAPAREPALAGVGGGTGTARPASGDGATGDGATGGDATGGTGDILDPDRPTLRPKLIWFNLALTVALLVLLGMDVLPLALVFVVATAIALVVNFPRPEDQLKAVTSHSASIVAVVAMVFAAAVLVGVLSGTGMVTAMANGIVAAVPPSIGSWFAVITGVLSMPLTFFLTNDAFYFGILPILTEAAGHYGIEPVEMARASIIGQPVHMTSPLVPALLLLVSLAKVNLADHHRKVIWRAAVCSLVMLATALVLGVVPVG
ncbi:CitH citrate transporter [Pseudonocardia sp. Ae168_Ps1]|uniref:CitMHS family transporter n=1 Tax=unclassified Pseudonocardia TaxID=2619320 RepID=UPI00094AD43F|nr:MULTISPECIES: SLC13 family permease [unclassified Pseudonocardia]OLL79855.1 CitH citrate transporter [Pseudonocardia sp. Ae168_Ps1]OLL86011.1 CitH citrate transporter [Pseudonocardia sp. Ae263_Ps1]OLL93958.1 CitH citrate transporter [Pseudonocardia sp. Ae356_Ps1]